MARSAVVIDPEYLKHDPGEFHPERPERIRALLDLAEKLDKNRFQILPPKAASKGIAKWVCSGAPAGTSRAQKSRDGFLSVQYHRDRRSASKERI